MLESAAVWKPSRAHPTTRRRTGPLFMPKQKLKTHKATARRMELTGSGKLRRTRQGKSHLRRNRSKRAQREYSKLFPVAGADLPRVKRLLPYAK